MSSFAAAASAPAPAYPILGTLRGISMEESQEYAPQIDGATFLGGSVVPGGVLVARLRGIDLECGDLACQAVTPGYRVELLPMCTFQGDDVLVGVRFHRDAPKAGHGCEVRFFAGMSRASTTAMVREA